MINNLLRIELKPDETIYLQIAEHVRMQVSLQRLRAGERLPAIRMLAQELRVDPGTVARAYRELEREGIITSRHASGSFIATRNDDRRLVRQRQDQLGQVMERALLEALGLGFTTEDVEAAFTARLAYWRGRRTQTTSKKRTAAYGPEEEICFMGSHDFAVELLVNHIGTLFPNLRFTTSFVGSMAGLVALECREANIAGAHLMDEETGEFNIPFVERVLPNESVVLMNLVQRIQGLIVAPDNPKHILGIEDLGRPDITFVNRQNGSGTRILLDSRLKRLGIATADINGYKREEKTHMAVASLIAEGCADVGLGTQSAASIAGLDFIPLVKERYDLIGLEENFSRPPLDKLQEVVRSEGFRSMLRSVPGYDVSETGTVITVN